MPNNDWSDYIYTMGAGSLYVNTEGASNTNVSEEMATINVMITSLGGECGDGNIEGYYSGTLYTPSNPNSGIYWEYDVAVEVEFSFSVPRLSTY